jgi:hypothetical protein
MKKSGFKLDCERERSFLAHTKKQQRDKDRERQRETEREQQRKGFVNQVTYELQIY